MHRLCTLGFLALVAALPAPAHAHIVLPGTQPFEAGAAFSPSTDCDGCHRGYDAGDDYEAGDGFWGSGMAHAARNPLFLAALFSAEIDSPHIGDFCLRCHAPAAFLEGRAEASDGSALFPEDRGVPCAFCHRLVEGEPEGPFVGNGRFFVDQTATYRGPFDDALDVGHQVGASDYLDEAMACGLCHEQSSPLHEMHDPDGDVIYPDFPSDRTWSEWEWSDYAAEGVSCQDCHMPRAAGRASGDEDAPERDLLHRHEWNAGGTLLADLLVATDETLGEDDVAAIEAGRERARASLQSAATLEIRTVSVRAGARDTVVVRVTNHAGHKLPTGFVEGRRMWLEVTLRDADGEVLLESGRYDPEEDEIVWDPNIRTYEALHGIVFMGPSFRSALNNMVLMDTRIPPRGFPQLIGERLDLLPWGRLYGSGDAETHQDDAPYEFAVPADVAGPLAVSARLLHQRVRPDYVRHLREVEVPGGVVEALVDAWAESGRGQPEEAARVEGIVEVLPPLEDAGAGDGAPGKWDGIGPALRRDAGSRPDRSPVPRADIPTGGPLPAGGGCSCGAAGTPGPIAPALLLLLCGIRRRLGPQPPVL